jgi:hypothetical protein
MAVVKSVSLSVEEAAFLVDNELSPSGLLQQAIKDVQTRLNSSDPSVSTEKKLEIAQRKVTLAYDFINKRGLFNDFLEEKAKQ